MRLHMSTTSDTKFTYGGKLWTTASALAGAVWAESTCAVTRGLEAQACERLTAGRVSDWCRAGRVGVVSASWVLTAPAGFPHRFLFSQGRSMIQISNSGAPVDSPVDNSGAPCGQLGSTLWTTLWTTHRCCG